MPANQGAGKGQGVPIGGMQAFLLLSFVAAILAFLLWKAKHDLIAAILIGFTQLVFLPIATLGSAIPKVAAIDQWMTQAAQMPQALTADALVAMLTEVGNFIRFLALPVAALLIVKAMRHPILRLNRKMDGEALIQYQSQVWKPIVPVAHLDLTNNTSPEWAPSKAGVTLARENKLVYANRLKLVECFNVFEAQLGRRLGEPLQPHEKALFAVFALRILRKRTASGKLQGSQLLDDLNESCRNKSRPDFSIALPLYELVRREPKVIAEINGHGYIRTALMQMLMAARREDGKLPTADFIWLKPVDRTLWYALDRTPVDYGRQALAAFAEGQGVVSQWQAEVVARAAKMRMGLTLKTADGTSYQVRIPYLVTAIAALAVELESVGVIEWPADLARLMADMRVGNERIAFDLVRDRYIKPGLKEHFEKLKEQALAQTIKSSKKPSGKPNKQSTGIAKGAIA